jgi:hypothetical protein
MQPFTMKHLPYAGVGGVTACICVSLIELPLRTVMGRVPALEYMLSSVHGLLWSYLIVVR